MVDHAGTPSGGDVSQWDLALNLDREAETPLYLQIVQAVADGVRKGRFKPGDPLPGTRALAEQLDVNRNTTLAAYQELEAEGWVVSAPDRGTFIADHPPVGRLEEGADVPAQDSGSWTSPSPITEPFYRPGAPGLDEFRLIPDLPDVRLAPVGAIQRAHGRVLNLQKHRILQPGWDPRGLLDLRYSLCRMLRELRGMAVEPGNVVLTRGLMSTLNLVSRVLFSPGDLVVVESPGPFRVWEAFRAAGARLRALPVDAQGLVVEALEDLLEEEVPRLLVVTTAPQYPTHAVLSPQRRARLLDLAESRGFLILEADPWLGFHRDPRPDLPLMASETRGRVVTFSGLDQILAPGLQVGLLVAPGPLAKALAQQRQLIDWPGNQVQEATLEELFRDAEIQRHLGRIRKLTAERRASMVDRLLLHLHPHLEVDDPREGLALWAKVAPDVPVEAWLDRCSAKGVTFYPGRLFELDRRPSQHVCLGFAALDVGEQNEACTRMAEALHEARRT